MELIAAKSPFVTAFSESDWFGRLIFLGLFLLSGISWAVLIHKGWILFQVRKFSREFISLFDEKDPLSLQYKPKKDLFLESPNPLFGIYKAVKTKTLAIISRNHLFSGTQENLKDDDLELLETESYLVMRAEIKKLEKNIFLLPTVVTLGPFAGLLGTVWGILVAFSKMDGKVVASGNEGMLAGLSLALVTTVIGLMIAIPALIGNNYYKNLIRDQRREMEDFSHLLITSTLNYYSQHRHAENQETYS